VYDHRQRVLQAAYEAHPERFVRGMPTPPDLRKEVWINQPETDITDVPSSFFHSEQASTQAVAKAQEQQVKQSLEEMIELPLWTELFDINFSSELSKNA
jgi:hypothetical protein